MGPPMRGLGAWSPTKTLKALGEGGVLLELDKPACGPLRVMDERDAVAFEPIENQLR